MGTTIYKENKRKKNVYWAILKDLVGQKSPAGAALASPVLGE